ncbi:MULTISPECIES: hypothetical protein [unclassified Methylophaga]|uniref:hypothetical protein n=1 Tax=unclassified Methylophaga TaxID=2629249 RepID=UPI0025DEFFA1|nr:MULTISPECIES: hypothetical protein [unclassified Methylophaga]|tara:strand:- start:55757 stop:56296 length:540 start_codon:yes stop_codon:yes gene_type:complete
MKLDLNQPANQSHIALAVGKSQQAVSKLAAKIGVAENLTNGQLLQALFQRLTDEAAGRGGADQAELTRMRIRESMAKAIAMETQNLKDLGLLISVEDLEPMLEQWATVSRSEVSNALMKIVADIEGEHDIAVNQDMVNGHISAAYKLIGDYPGRYQEDSESVIALDDEPDRKEMDTAEE